MKIKFFFFIILFAIFTSAYAKINKLDDKAISVKDFLILKFDIFMQNNMINIIRGGGVTAVAYQSVNYKFNIDDQNNILILVNAIMDKKRYMSKKYIPKLRDCIQVRNKIFVNKYGYSPFRQKFNNLVNEEILTNNINDYILDISSLNDDLKNKLLNKAKIKINLIHPKKESNISCSGRLVDTKLTK